MSTMINTPETYNGWKNYPTWAVNLWLSNDQGLYEVIRENIETIRATGDPETRRVDTADYIKETTIEMVLPDLGGSLTADLLGYSVAMVDWFEIADAWLSE